MPKSVPAPHHKDPLIQTMERLERALELLVVPAPRRGVYYVGGGEEAHAVNLSDESAPACDCGDHLWRARLCKHIAAVLMARGAKVRDVFRAMKASEAGTYNTV